MGGASKDCIEAIRRQDMAQLSVRKIKSASLKLAEIR